MEHRVKVLLVDDHEIVRSGLRALLDNRDDMWVVGEASDGRRALELIAKLQPDVVVMDLGMPELNGIDATRQAISLRPGIKVIALSASADERTTVEILRAGASGFVPKMAAFEELITAILTVIKNRVYFNAEIISRVSDHGGDSAQAPTAFDLLSIREREVLQLIAEGKATKEVAMHLGVSVKTVETHRRNLMEKLKVDSVAELTKYAIRERLTQI